MMDFWTLLVENTFGGFYMAIFGMALIMGLILMMGGVSIYTITWFIMIFLYVMFLGNGVWLIVVPVWILIFYMFMKGLLAFIDSYYRGGQ
jgi:hypothetical protein